MTRHETVKLIKQLEKDYCKDVAILGVDGWMKYISDDCVFTTQGHHKSVKGKENIRKRLEGLYTADEVLYHWDVEYVDVSEDLTMAYSYSYFTYKIVKGEDKKCYIGKDCNIWRKIGDDYKVVMQIGSRIESTFDADQRCLGKIEKIKL